MMAEPQYNMYAPLPGGGWQVAEEAPGDVIDGDVDMDVDVDGDGDGAASDGSGVLHESMQRLMEITNVPEDYARALLLAHDGDLAAAVATVMDV
jgi:NACalpha-BTF3-like transcription factor